MKYARKNQTSIFLHGTCMAYSQTSFPFLDLLWMGYGFPKATVFRPSQTELNTKAQGTQIMQAVHVFGGKTDHS